MPESPNKGGRKPRVADEDLLEVFRSTSDPVLSTAEVAGQVPIKRRGTLTRLRKLTDEGTLASKQIGGRNTVWWIPDKGQQNDHSRLSEQSEPIDDESSKSQQGHQEDVAQAQETSVLDELEFPSGKDQSECNAAIRAAREYIQQNGSATKKEIVPEIMPQYSLGYNVDTALSKIEAGERYRGSWWRKIVKPGLEALDDVEKPSRGQSEWRVQ